MRFTTALIVVAGFLLGTAESGSPISPKQSCDTFNSAAFLNSHRHTRLSIGEVALISGSESIPNGWRLLTAA